MFGKNQILKQDLGTGHFWVQEIFHTIQGEGPYSGKPAVFLRLAGCNLRCHFCDTDFESSTTYFTAAQIQQEISKYPCKFVVITGGEPFRQNLYEICKPLIVNGFKIQIETAGTLWQDELWHPVRDGQIEIVCSPKTGSVHPMIEANCYHWKYIIKDGETDPYDGLPNKSTQRKGEKLYIFHPKRPTDTIWLQPMAEYDKKGDPDWDTTFVNTQLAAKLCMEHDYRLTLQTHKMIGLP
jgi:organic radical activating enzyme